jgi:hypothetical protein
MTVIAVVLCIEVTLILLTLSFKVSAGRVPGP